MPRKKNWRKARKGKKFDELTRCVRGLYSQNSDSFDQFSRGKQCVPNSILSLVYGKVKDIDQWKADDLHAILESGDQWYNKIRECMQISNDFLLLNEVPREGTAFGKKFKFEILKTYAGMIEGTDPVLVDANIMDLSQTLDNSLQNNANCILTCGGNTCAIFTKNDHFYVFDAHSRNSQGLLTANGKCIRLRFDSVNNLKTFLLNLFHSLGINPKDPYEFSTCSVTITAECGELCVNHASGIPDLEVVHESSKKFCFKNISDEDCDTIIAEFDLVCSPIKDGDVTISYIDLEAENAPSQIIKIVGDGNCFFRALDVALTGKDNSNYVKFRHFITEHLAKNFNLFKFAVRDEFEDVHEQLVKNNTRCEGSWATELEIYGAADLLNTSIFTFYQNKWMCYPPRKPSIFAGSIYLLNRNNHFEVVMNTVNVHKTKNIIAQQENNTNEHIDLNKQALLHNKSSKQNKTQYNSRYQNDARVRSQIKKSVKQKYKTDEEYQYKLRLASSAKYHKNADFQQTLKKKLKRKYEDDEEERKNKIAKSKMRYSTNDDLSRKVKKYSTTKYHENEDFKEKVKQYSITKYRDNINFKEKVKQYSSVKYEKNEDFKNNLNAYSIKKYAASKDEIKDKNLERYHNDDMYKEKTIVRSMNNYMLSKTKTKNFEQLVVDFSKHATNNCPEYICVICIRLLFVNQVIAVADYEKKSPLFQSLVNVDYYHTCKDDCNEPCKFKNNISGKWWICYNCKFKLKKNNVPHEAFNNNMDPGPVPEELKCLNSLESHLIALNLPFIKILTLPKGGQSGVLGPVTCVPSRVENSVNCLPRMEGQDKMIHVKLKRKLQYKGHYKYNFVDEKKVKTAINYLKKNNTLYKDIQINDEWVNSLQRNESDSNSASEDSDFIEEAGESELIIGHTNDSCLQPIDIGAQLLDFSFDEVLCLAPAEGNSPIHVLTDVANEAKCFPTLYPKGSNTFKSERLDLTASRYFHCRLMCADTRWSQSTEYIFFAQYVSELLQVQSSISIAMRKGRSLDKISIKASDLLKGDHLRKALLNDDAYKFLKPIRGTPAFWYNAQKDLFAMVRQLGVPTWFCSFSSADFRWTEFLQVLLNNSHDARSVNELDWEDKAKLIKDNPITIARMFQQRFDFFLKKVILSNASPIGKVKDYFFRVEFQMRGSPHIHSIFWIDGAPKYGIDSNETIVKFIDQYVTCKLPPPEQPELREVVTSVQRHSAKHSKTCKKKGTVCRFEFPRPPSSRTFIATGVSDDSSDDKNLTQKGTLLEMYKALSNSDNNYDSVDSWFAHFELNQEKFEELYTSTTNRPKIVLKRDLKSTWINAYSETLLTCWDANMDIQFILDPFSCVVYILSYISKAEKELSLILESLKNDSELVIGDSKKALNKLGSFYLKNREVSAQEAAYRVCNLPLKSCSRKVVFIPIGSKQIRLSLPLKEIQKLCENQDNVENVSIWASSIIDKYEARPKSADFVNMCLADFASKYRILSTTEAQNCKDKIKLLDGKSCFVKKRTRTQEAVIRYYHVSREQHPIQYYQNMLQLFLPYYFKQQLLPPGFQSFEDFYLNGHVTLNDSLESVRIIVDKGISKYEKNTEILEVNIHEISDDQLEDAWAKISPEAEIDRTNCKTEKEQVNIEEDELQIPDLADKDKPNVSAIESLQNKISEKRGVGILRSLNTQQKNVFGKIRSWCIEYICGNNPPPFYVFITGSGGTGKSHLINAIYFECDKLLRKSIDQINSNPVLLTASTGIAAFNIGGNTLHSAFKIPIAITLPYVPLSQDSVNSLRSKHLDLRVLIIDEISMVSDKLLIYVSYRLQQIKQRDDLPFGGVSIISVGDFYQLPPVKAKPLYESCYELWSHFKVVELTEVMRQKGDNLFIDILNFIRTKSADKALPISYHSILKSRCDLQEPEDIINIFGTNKEVDQHNNEMLQKICLSITVLNAIDTNKTCSAIKQRSKGRSPNFSLPNTIRVGINAKVMLMKNLNLIDGLINGALGIIKEMQMNTDNIVEVLWIQFEKENIGEITRANSPHQNDKTLTPIARFTETTYGIERCQFPIKLAWAVTVHKTQGLSFEKAAISMKKIFLPGQAYVALSRVMSLDGLFIRNFKTDSLYANEEISANIKSMTPFTTELVDAQSNCTVRIGYLNVEGIVAHFEDVKEDMKTWECDCVLLCETHINCKTNTSHLSIPEYKFLSRQRWQCYNTNSDIGKLFYNKNGGGVGAYIKHQSLLTYNNDEKADIEYLTLKCKYNVNNDFIYISVIYRPPSYPLKTFTENLKLFLNKNSAINLILGDFNENLLEEGKKHEIQDVFKYYGFVQKVSDSNGTTDRCTLLDHVYIKNAPDTFEIKVVQTYYSYHQAIILNL